MSEILSDLCLNRKTALLAEHIAQKQGMDRDAYLRNLISRDVDRYLDASPKRLRLQYYLLIRWAPVESEGREFARRLFYCPNALAARDTYLRFLTQELKADEDTVCRLRRGMRPFHLGLLDGRREQVAGVELQVELISRREQRTALCEELCEALLGTPVYCYRLKSGVYYLDFPAGGHLAQSLEHRCITPAQREVAELVYSLEYSVDAVEQVDELLRKKRRRRRARTDTAAAQ